MDKFFLLTYTKTGYDGLRHSYHAWFEKEEDLRRFVEADSDIEVDISIEILKCREIVL